MSSLYDLSADLLGGEAQSLSAYRGKVSLVVNVASAWGYTEQYKGLQSLYEQLSPRGFEVLAFPCNQFAAEEPGTPQQIRAFTRGQYGVTFPLFAKVNVNGSRAHAVWKFLTAHPPGGEIEWNFEKFLLDRDGHVLSRHSPRTEPSAMLPDILCALGAAGGD